MALSSRTLVLAAGITLLIGALIVGRLARSSAPKESGPPERPTAEVSIRKGPTAKPALAEAPPAAPSSSPDAQSQEERRLARAEMTLQAYLDATRYPPDARPIAERPDLALPHQAPVRTLPLARPDLARTAAQVTLRQDRYFAAAEQEIKLGITCSSDAGPARCEVLSARAMRPPDMPGAIDPVPVTFGDDGQGGATAVFHPARTVFSSYRVHISVT